MASAPAEGGFALAASCGRPVESVAEEHVTV